MKNEGSSFGNTIKGLALGITVGAIATMLLSNNSTTKKIKKAVENTGESISSMFKMN